MPGPTCLITGATSGIGRAVAHALAARGASLILLGRHQRRGEALKQQLARVHPSGRFEYVACDLSNLDAVCEAASTIQSRHARIDGLVNNAGARFDGYEESADGIELTFATNHLGHFLLTQLLRDRLCDSPSPRIINVTSSARLAVQTIDTSEWMIKRGNYDRRQAYARSKLANVVFTVELARRFTGSRHRTVAVDPGIVATRFALNNGLIPWLRHVISHGLRGELSSPALAGRWIAQLALGESDFRQSTCLVRDGHNVPLRPLESDRAVGAGLWELSEVWIASALRETVRGG